MTDSYAAILKEADAWFSQAIADGWLDQTDRARLENLDRHTPADLFRDQPGRPLVVAFFGGTGVGKSSLLNRLAEAPIAQTGAERPTSRVATVYVHESIALADLPPEFPTANVRVERHKCDAHRGLLWLDAPDIDSTEETNRQAALAWLPHADLVCYVVSPERYRDDVGWRVLHARGHKHGWIFVFNRWDEGHPDQAADFVRMLNSAGFEDPLLLRTCCLPGRSLPSTDQFDELRTALTRLLDANGLRELERLGVTARLQELRIAIEAAQRKLGDQATWENLIAAAQQRWELVVETILDGTEWSSGVIASRAAALQEGLTGRLSRRPLLVRRAGSIAEDKLRPGCADTDIDRLASSVWDGWAQSKLEAYLDASEVAASRAGVPPRPVRRQLEQVSSAAARLLTEHLAETLRLALARPGTALGRLGRRVTGFLTTFLPAAALLWVAWITLSRYHEASRGAASFLDTAFAVHSALVVLIAWALPFTLDRLLRPSLGRTVQCALRAGLRSGLAELGRQFEQSLRTSAAAAEACRRRGQAIISETLRSSTPRVTPRGPAVERLVMQPKRGLAALTHEPAEA